jgi:hypothetical protein
MGGCISLRYSSQARSHYGILSARRVMGRSMSCNIWLATWPNGGRALIERKIGLVKRST